MIRPVLIALSLWMALPAAACEALCMDVDPAGPMQGCERTETGSHPPTSEDCADCEASADKLVASPSNLEQRVAPAWMALPAVVSVAADRPTGARADRHPPDRTCSPYSDVNRPLLN